MRLAASPSVTDRLSQGGVAARSAVLPVGLIVLAAVVLRFVLGTDTDVSWLITVNEKLLAGERLYTEVLETNPPAAVFIYWLPVALGQVVGARPEIAVDLFVFVWAGGVLWVSAWVLREGSLLGGLNRTLLLAIAAAILLILPMMAFGQREHFAAMAILPMLLVYARRAAGENVGLLVASVAALGAALALAIKPPLGIVLASAAITAAWRAGSIRVIVAPENLICGALFAIYLAAIQLIYPVYFAEITPALADVYAPNRITWELLLQQPPLILWAVLWAVTLALRPRSPAVAVLMAASLGGAIAYLVQGKGWAYQAYPMVAFGALAFTCLLGGWRYQRGAPLGPRGVLVAVVVLAVAMGQVGWMALTARLTEVAPEVRQLSPRPTMLLIGNNIAMGHPLVRAVEGRWVGSLPMLWASAGARKLAAAPGLTAETMRHLAAYEVREREILAADIGRHRPDLIVIGTVPFDWGAWARQDPALAALLDRYEPAMDVRGGVILRRRGGV